MARSSLHIFWLTALAIPCLFLTAMGQSRSNLAVSDHLRVQAPMDRVWLARDSITEMERCWQFMNRATGGMLPSQIIVLLSKEAAVNSINLKESVITIGLGNPAASYEVSSFIEKSAVKEMARIGLINLSGGARAKSDCEFLIFGMAEILVHEYTQSTRTLKSAWVIAHYLDQMNLLGLKMQSDWASFSEGNSNLRAASPGVTFLEFCREQYGREKLKKIFAGLKMNSLSQSLYSAFRSSPETLESEWLKKVREYSDFSDMTFDSDNDAPQFKRAELVPGTARPGASLQIRLFIQDDGNNLSASGVFLRDETSGSVFQARVPVGKDAGYVFVDLPIEAGRQPGSYAYSATAVDEEGNIRNWRGTYVVP
jgi:hypothetical protein